MPDLISYDTTYDALIETISHYYGGTQTIGWQEISAKGFTNENILEVINSMPNQHAIQNADGTVRVYMESYTADTVSSTASTASAINSNAQAGTAASTATITAPAQTAYQTVGGYKTFQAAKGGLTGGMTGTQFICRSLVPALCAASAGITLGKTIDKVLYNVNPDFWDEHNMSMLDPAKWAAVTSDNEGAALFNFIYGIQPTGNVQPYMDETAFAYMALFMQQAGVLDSYEEWILPESEQASLQYPNNYSNCVYYNMPVTYITIDYYGNPTTYDYFVNSGNNVKYVFVRRSYPAFNQLQVYMISDEPFNYTYRYQSGSYIYTHSYDAGSYTRNNITYYCSTGGVFNPESLISQFPQYIDIVDMNANHTSLWDIAHIFFKGDIETVGIEGIGSQDGAVLPVLNNDMTVDEVLATLKTQYPGLWTNAVQNDVAQPDGSITTYTYVPVAYPQAVSNTDTQPTGDGQQSSQVKPYYDPLTENDFSFLWDVIDHVTPDYYDTAGGTGETPAAVIPTGSASALWKIYNPSQSQLDSFGAWLWSANFVDQLLKLFNDPMQAIIGLHKIFVTPPVSGSGPIKVGYLTSDASANYVSSQYVDIDCGTVELMEYFGNVFDYTGTNVKIYLPFIGIQSLSIDDCMRGALNVVYHVDVLTGACLAEIKVTRDLGGGTLYTFSGNCAVQYPVSSGSYVGIVTGLLGVAGGIAGTVASGGALAPVLMGVGASVGNMHTDVEHSGNISSNAGAMGIKKPYLIIERTQPKMPAQYEKIEGIPSNEFAPLSSCSGYVKVKKCHTDGIPATRGEIDMIYSLLTSGVVV